MPYAANGKISQDPIEGGIEISKEQEAAAIAGMLTGLVVSIDGGFKVGPPPEPEAPAPPSKESRISLLQTIYDSDRDKLNRAWLSAMIADGVEETARKTAIEGEMAALDAQLEVDILTIIMEA